MTSKLNVLLLSPLLLAVVALRVAGGPVVTTPTESSSEETSGEELETELANSPLISIKQYLEAWCGMHKKQFEKEFEQSYDFLNIYRHMDKFPSPKLPGGSFKKESRLLKLVQGLLKYWVLLEYVEKVYPRDLVLLEAKPKIPVIISEIKQNMRHPERATGLDATEEQALRQIVANTDEFQRKMSAHKILREFLIFLKDSYHELAKLHLT